MGQTQSVQYFSRKGVGPPPGFSVWPCGILLTVLFDLKKRKVPFKGHTDLEWEIP